MKSLRKRFAKHDEGERSKYDDKILEYVLANDVDKLRSAIEKKKFSALNTADDRGRIPPKSYHDSIFEACKLGQKDCVDILATVDTDSIPTDADGRTPLHVAALTGNRDCVTTLLRRGWSVNQPDEHQNTALHLAASYGQLDVLQTLIGYQADTEARDGDQSTPLIVAAKFNQLDAAVALLKNSVSVNAANIEDKTALMYACDHGNVELVQKLLACGAQADRKDIEGRNARQIATDRGHSDIVRLLGGEPLKKTDNQSARTQSREKVTVSDPDGLRRQLEAERKALAEAKEEISSLKAQLDAFREQDNGDTVEFGSDDEIDLEGDNGSAPKQNHTPKHENKHGDETKALNKQLRHEIEQLQAQLKTARAEETNARQNLAAAESEAEILRVQLSTADVVPLGFVPESEVEALKDQVAALQASAGNSGNTDALVQQHDEQVRKLKAAHDEQLKKLKSAHDDEVASLRAAIAAARADADAQAQQAAADAAAATKQHDSALQLYRYYLALASKGALPADVKEAVLEAVGNVQA